VAKLVARYRGGGVAAPARSRFATTGACITSGSAENTPGTTNPPERPAPRDNETPEPEGSRVSYVVRDHNGAGGGVPFQEIVDTMSQDIVDTS